MKTMLTCLITFALIQPVISQQPALSVSDMEMVAGMAIQQAANKIVSDRGYEVIKTDFPASNTAQNSDSTIYLMWTNSDGTSYNRIMLNAKITEGVKTRLVTITSSDSTWFYAIQKSLTGNSEYKLSNTKLNSDDAHDAAIYEHGNYRITIQWTTMGTDRKFYLVDVNWFE